MRIEHKLSPTIANYAREAIRQLNEIRREYLVALGTAKELQDRSEAIKAALGQQLMLVKESEGLPEPVAPYVLSEDGARLIGDIAEINNSVKHEQ
jgi:hypothetical protein